MTVDSGILDEVLDQLDNIASVTELFYEKRRFTIYKNIAVPLRLLLTGSSGDEGLVHHLPAVTLPKLLIVPPGDCPKEHMTVPGLTVIGEGYTGGTLTMEGGVRLGYLQVQGGAVDKTRIEAIFNFAAPKMALDNWLAQPFLRPEWKLKDFIATVGNKDGTAHYNPTNEKMLAYKQWGYFHWHIVARMGSSLEQHLRAEINTQYPNHVRAIR